MRRDPSAFPSSKGLLQLFLFSLFCFVLFSLSLSLSYCSSPRFLLLVCRRVFLGLCASSLIIIDADVVLFFDAYISIYFYDIYSLVIFMVNVYISFHYLHYSYLFLIDRPLRQSSFLEFYTSSCSTALAHSGY